MDKHRELVEGITVALLNVRNDAGKRIPVPNPMYYAELIANDVAKATPMRRKEIVWQKPAQAEILPSEAAKESMSNPPSTGF